MPISGRVTVRIFRPSRRLTQSGRRGEREWIIEFEPAVPPGIDPLMGWTSSRDPLGWQRLRFPDRESAVAFARKRGWRYEVEDPAPSRIRPKSYAADLARRC